MPSPKIRVALIAVLMVAQAAFVYWANMRRPDVPPSMRPWRPLGQRTAEERDKFVQTTFALDGFDIRPLAAKATSVKIPRPAKWREQMVLCSTEVGARPAQVEREETPAPPARAGRDETPNGSTTGTPTAKVTLIAASTYETVPPDNTAPAGKTDLILLKEKLAASDGYMTNKGLPVPLVHFFRIAKLYVDKKDNTLVQTERAVQVNGVPSENLSSIVPHWLLPQRELKVGETWVQVGVHPMGVGARSPRPKVDRTLKRLVSFEGRRAAEISSTSTCYEFATDSTGVYPEHVEESVIYVDLETGEPLWYEARSKNDSQYDYLVRGCNQLFSEHLLRVSRK